jgi:hypothetical protein
VRQSQGGTLSIPPKRAPFYPLSPGLGKHGAILLW